jgi:hypothetical protein
MMTLLAEYEYGGRVLSYRQRAWQHQSGVMAVIFSEVLVASLTEEKFLREQFRDKN